MDRLAPGWYVLLYHDVSWEDHYYVRAIGGTIPPDLFRAHVEAVSALGEVVGIEEGRRRWCEQLLDRPVFSLWFDDGLAGVARHAAPILDDAGLTAAASICSRFVDRSEFFWRFKLAYLSTVDGMRFVRSRLRRDGFTMADSVREFTLDHFSAELLADIDELFDRFTTPAQRPDAHRVFMDHDAVAALAAHGWEIANHSAAHHPVNHHRGAAELAASFDECEAAIVALTGAPSRFWVLPFDRHSPEAMAAAAAARGPRWTVLADERANRPPAPLDERVVHRVSAPRRSARHLVDRLLQLQA